MAHSATSFRQAPRIWVVEPVIQRLDTLHPLALRKLGWVGLLEEAGSQLDQPLGLNLYDFSHVFLGGEYELVVNEPLRVSVEQSGRRVDINDLPRPEGM